MKIVENDGLDRESWWVERSSAKKLGRDRELEDRKIFYVLNLDRFDISRSWAKKIGRNREMEDRDLERKIFQCLKFGSFDISRHKTPRLEKASASGKNISLDNCILKNWGERGKDFKTLESTYFIDELQLLVNKEKWKCNLTKQKISLALSDP